MASYDLIKLQDHCHRLQGNIHRNKKKTYEKDSERFGIEIQSDNYIKFQTPRTYCAANSDDLTEVVDYVKKIHPNVLLGATGISMGG